MPGNSLKQRQGAGGRICVILALIALVLFTLSVREGNSGPISVVKSGFTLVTTPVRFLGDVVSKPFGGLGNVFENLTADQQTLSDLKAENDKLKSENAKLKEYEQSADRLQGLLKIQNTYSLQSTGASIISGSVDSWSNSVIINKGSTSGLAVGMPVCDASGVIGQISECGLTSSTVRLISDENSSVSAMVQDSRAQGMLRGSADGSLHLDLIRTDQNVKVGDIVVTSGLGGVYPKGLPLGTVSSVERSEGSLYYGIQVKPYSAGSYEEVLVITSLTEDQQATKDEAAEADAQEAQSATTAAATDAATNAATNAATQATSVNAQASSANEKANNNQSSN